MVNEFYKWMPYSSSTLVIDVRMGYMACLQL